MYRALRDIQSTPTTVPIVEVVAPVVGNKVEAEVPDNIVVEPAVAVDNTAEAAEQDSKAVAVEQGNTFEAETTCNMYYNPKYKKIKSIYQWRWTTGPVLIRKRTGFNR